LRFRLLESAIINESNAASQADASRLYEFVDAFEEAWQAGGRPDIDRYLPPDAPLRRTVLIKLVHIDLENCLRAGEKVRVETYLDRYPQIAGDTSAIVELVTWEFALRRGEGGGEGDLTAEFLRRFPQYADVLSAYLSRETSSAQSKPLRHAAAPSPPAPVHDTMEAAGVHRSRNQETLNNPRAEAEARTSQPRLPGYEMLGELGRGGMGVVYKALHLRLNRVVALKMILAGSHAGAAELARFQTEAQAIAHLQHPNIVQVHEVGEHEGTPFLSLEFCGGGSLAQKTSGTPLPPHEAARIVEELARAIEAAHQKGVIHRDLKPANVLLLEDGTLKVSDFGLARKLDDVGQTQSGAIMGTPSYMAPEQAEGKVKEIRPAADVYALGAILYEMLTGRPPFKGASPVDTLHMVIGSEPVSPRQLQANVPRDLETICLKCLRKEPAKRYDTAAELAEDLGRFQAGESVKARPVGAFERGLKWIRRHPATAAAYGLVLVVVVLGGLGGGVTWLWQRSEDARKETELARERLAEITYLHQVALAQREWENAGVARAGQLLESCPPERRGWEWRYVYRLCHADLCTLTGHAAQVNSVAFSPDGKRLVSGSSDNTLKVWDVQTALETFTCWGHTDLVVSVAFSRDGLRLLSASRDHTIRVWDAQTGREILLIPQTDSVRSAALSPDGNRIASATDDGKVTLWDARTGLKLRTVKGGTHLVNCVAFSPDGRRFAGGISSLHGGGVQVWDGQSGEEVRTMKHAANINGVAFSPLTNRVAGAASSDKTVQIWDVQTGQALLTLLGHTNFVNQVAFSPNGQLLASTSTDETVRVWDAATGQELISHKGHKNGTGGVAFSPDGQCVASASSDATVKLWKATVDPRSVSLHGHTNMINDVKISPDGEFIASAAVDGTVRIWDVRSKQQVLDIRADDRRVDNVTFSPDGHRLVSGGREGLKVWETKTGKLTLSMVGHRMPVRSVAYSADGTRIASASGHWQDLKGNWLTDEVKVWDAQTGRELLSLRGGDSRGLICVAFSPDSKRLVCGGDRSVTVWNLATEKQELCFPAHDDTIVCVAFSPNGETIATASFDKTVKIWHAATGKHVLTFAGHTTRVTCVAYSPDGQRLATGGDDSTVRIIVASSGEEALSLKGTLGPVHCLAFSPDGKLLVSGGHDRLLRVWDARPLEGRRTS
jgi:WD40 repeat protein